MGEECKVRTLSECGVRDAEELQGAAVGAKICSTNVQLCVVFLSGAFV